MKKFLYRSFITGSIFSISLLVMMEGWGLHPQNWAWIIGGYVMTILFAALGPAVQMGD